MVNENNLCRGIQRQSMDLLGKLFLKNLVNLSMDLNAILPLECVGPDRYVEVRLSTFAPAAMAFMLVAVVSDGKDAGGECG